jgi:hypothetical protein
MRRPATMAFLVVEFIRKDYQKIPHVWQSISKYFFKFIWKCFC